MKEGWKYIFLDFQMEIKMDDRVAVADNCIEMFLKDERERQIDTGTCAAILKTENKHSLVGQFYGKIYNAEIENDLGKFKMVILCCKNPDNPNFN